MNNEINEFKKILIGDNLDKCNLIDEHLYLNIFAHNENWNWYIPYKFIYSYYYT